MQMSLADLGALGEFFSAFAVIASVLYLAVQIRHGIRASEGAAVQAVTAQFSSMQFALAGDGELSDIIARAKRGDALTDVEAGRAGDMLSAYLIAFENMFWQSRSGLLDHAGYEARERIIAWLLSSDFARTWWEGFGRRSHPQLFVDDVDRILRAAEAEGVS